MSKRYSVSQREAVAIYRRVLKLVNSFIVHNMPSDSLVCNRRGTLMTWRELRKHMRESIALKVKP